MTPKQKQAVDLYYKHSNLTKVAKLLNCSRQNVLILVQNAGVWLPRPKNQLCPCCNLPATTRGLCSAAYGRWLRNGSWHKIDRKHCTNCKKEIRKGRGRIRGLCEKCAYHLDPLYREKRNQIQRKYDRRKAQGKRV